MDPHLVIPEIQRRTVARRGPALLFKRVKGSEFPVATNLFGSAKRMELAFGRRPQEVLQELTQLMDELPPGFASLWHHRRSLGRMLRLGLKRRKHGPIMDRRLGSLRELPALTCWPEDGGPFVALPLVYTQDPESGHGNLGMYRIQVQDRLRTGMHIQIHRGGGNHYVKAERMGKALPAAVFVGGPPALIIAAVAPLPEDVPELLFASFLMGRKLELVAPGADRLLPLVAESDFCIYGEIPPNRREDEGPFGDHYGYYSLKHPYPVLDVRAIYARKDAVFPATVVGRPPQEDHFIAVYLQDLLKPLFPLVMKGVKDVFAFEESGVHSAAAAIVHERYYRESFTASMRLLGEGQLSLTKVLFATDAEVDVRDFRALLEAVLARCAMESDLHIFGNISLDTLDYTGPDINRGSKALFLGTGAPRFELADQPPTAFSNAIFAGARVFCPGCLLVKGPTYDADPLAATALVQQTEIASFRLVILHDDPADAASSAASFLWNVFTRFEPGGDIHGRRAIVRNHLAYSAPLVIDARLKPGYPRVLVPDRETVDRVDRVWDGLGIETWCANRAR